MQFLFVVAVTPTIAEQRLPRVVIVVAAAVEPGRDDTDRRQRTAVGAATVASRANAAATTANVTVVARHMPTIAATTVVTV